MTLTSLVLDDAKHELIRQLEHQKSTGEPVHNRKLTGRTIRHPGARAPEESASPAG